MGTTDITNSFMSCLTHLEARTRQKKIQILANTYLFFVVVHIQGNKKPKHEATTFYRAFHYNHLNFLWDPRQQQPGIYQRYNYSKHL